MGRLMNRTTALAVLAVAAVVTGGFAVQARVTSSAFHDLESAQIAQDADRIRIGLDCQVQLPSKVGATNSIWDDAFAAVGAGDQAALTEAFPADVMGSLGVDGLIGIGPDGPSGPVACGAGARTTPRCPARSPTRPWPTGCTSAAPGP